jgi:dTDP-4-amino-4,6-dideoxygalactose transaminase
MSFEIISKFENEISNFFGAPYAVAVDCCTHGLELCLRMTNAHIINVPKHTYIGGTKNGKIIILLQIT